MSAIRCVLTALAFGIFGGVSAGAAETPISAFPKDTGIIVRLKNPQKTLKTAGDLAVKVDRKEGIKVQMGGPVLGLMISNPSLKGVDMAGDWWLGVFPVADGDPGVVFCIPATDADALKGSVTGDYQFQTFEKWVIYTEHAASSDKIKQQLANKGESVSSLMDKSATGVWDGGDLSVFVNVPELLKTYRGPFEDGVKQVNDMLEQMPALVPPQSGVDMKTIFEMYAGAFNQFVQGVKDAQGCTAGLSVSADGLSLHEYAGFTDGSKTSNLLAKYQPTGLEALGRLPAKKLGYGAAELDMGALMQWSMKYTLQMFAEGDTEKQKQAKALMEEYAKLKFGGVAMSFGLGDPKQGAFRASALLDVEQPQKVRELSKKSSELLGDYSIAGMKMKMTYESEAETYGDLKADVARVKYEFDQNADPLQVQIQKQMNEILYGPDGMVTRTFYMKDRMAQSIGGDKTDAQAVLDALEGKNAAGDDPAFQTTRKQLLPKACLIGLVDLPGTLAAGLNLAIKSGARVPLNENDIKEVRGEPSYLGFSLATEPNGLRAKTVVPVQQMQGIARFARLIEAAENQGI